MKWFIPFLFLSSFATAASFGPFFPASCTNAPQIGGVSGWTSPTNAEVEDGVYSTYGAVESYYLYCSSFNFSSLPVNMTITGIQVGIKHVDINGNGVVDVFVQLFEGGAAVGNNNADSIDDWPTTLTWKYYGGSSDLWGLPIKLSTIQDPAFGCGIATAKDDGPPLWGIDAESITVFGTVPTTIYNGIIH